MPRLLLAALFLAVLPRAAVGAPVDVPVEMGLGPAAFTFAGPMYGDQPLHTGLRLHFKAVLDEGLVEAHENAMPSVLAERIRSRGEIRVGYWAIPESIFLSPERLQTSVWGATWRMGSFEWSWGRTVKLRFGAGFLFTYARIVSEQLRSPTHFARPGTDAKLELELALGDHLRLTLGGSSQLYLPQQLGASPFGSVLSSFHHLRRSIWHIANAYLVLGGRFPVSVNL